MSLLWPGRLGQVQLFSLQHLAGVCLVEDILLVFDLILQIPSPRQNNLSLHTEDQLATFNLT